MDALTPLLEKISLTARIFFSGVQCQLADFDAHEGVGHLHLLRSGRVSVRIRGADIQTVDRPSAILFPRPRQHSLVPIDPEGINLVCASVDLGARVRSPLAMALPEHLILPIDGKQPIASTLELLFSEAFDTRAGRQAALDRLAEYFLIQILRHVIESGVFSGGILAAIADQRLSLAVIAMHEKPSHPWTLEQLADTAGMSRARFAANFRKVTGITPHKYLTDWRISVAQTLLKQGKSLKTVAMAVGYGNSAALTRAFSQQLGVSPTIWLRDTRPS